MHDAMQHDNTPFFFVGTLLGVFKHDWEGYTLCHYFTQTLLKHMHSLRTGWHYHRCNGWTQCDILSSGSNPTIVKGPLVCILGDGALWETKCSMPGGVEFSSSRSVTHCLTNLTSLIKLFESWKHVVPLLYWACSWSLTNIHAHIVSLLLILASAFIARCYGCLYGVPDW